MNGRTGTQEFFLIPQNNIPVRRSYRTYFDFVRPKLFSEKFVNTTESGLVVNQWNCLTYCLR